MTDRRTDLMIRQSKANNEFFGKGTIMSEYKRAAYDTVWERLTGMEQYEVESKINGLRNWKINFGDHTVALGRYDRSPHMWSWSLWRGDWDLIDSGSLTFEGLKINAHQVARVVMLLAVDYADANPYACPHGCGYEASSEDKINFHLDDRHGENVSVTF